jgi:tetratricopeptide (TPR) repeat protein
MTETPNRATDDQVKEVATALRTPDVARAVELARRHLDDGFVHPMFLNLRAYWHEQAGRLTEAFRDLDQARAAAPDDPIILNAYGLCAARLGRSEEAFVAFDTAAKVDPAFAQAHFNAGWTAESLGELDRAKSAYRRTIEIAPDASEAHSSLAWLCARTADWDQARDAARRALELAPGRPIPKLALATADLNTGAAAAAEQLVKEVLATDGISRIDRGIALGLLGDCLDRRDDVNAAFEAYGASNAQLRDEYAAQVAGRSSETVLSMVSWLNAHFAKAASAWARTPASRGPDDAPSQHIFLVGFPRSGTTLLEQILASHPAIVTMDEKEALAEAVRTFMRSPDTLDRLRDAEVGELDAARAQYWARIRGYGVEPRGKVFIDKLALNSIKLPLIAKLFPQARVLLALRDPRDVVWGCFRQRFQMNAAMLEFTSLENTAQLYAGTMTLLAAYWRVLPLDVHTIRNEDLVCDFDAQVAQLCAFIGVPFDANMRDFAERRRQRAVSTPSSVQVARGLYDSGGQWRRYARHLEPILPIVQPWVERYGYPPDP